jgi:DGQHR domain-containing protein
MNNKPRSLSFPAIKVKQPVGEFFIAAIPWKDLWDIAYVDVREMNSREVDTYLGIQRKLSFGRATEIAQYVKSPDASFPTSIILAVKGICAEWDEMKSELTLSEYIPDPNEKDAVREAVSYDSIAKILDGQHRLAGMEDYQGPEFQLNVSIFVDMDIADQANIFATVNLAQTKVNKSLVYDLYDLAKHRSPQKTCHNVAVALDKVDGSPFYKKIKRLGVSTIGRFNETVSQATIVETLMSHLSRNPVIDRQLLMAGKALPKPTEQELRDYVFRGLFCDGEDEEITKIVWTYFEAVKKKWPAAWDDSERGLMLNKTNGVRAFMHFLGKAYLHVASKIGDQVSIKQFADLFEPITLKDSDFNTENFKPGAGGEGKLYRQLITETQVDVKLSRASPGITVSR